jgi:hypothetical protein
VVEEQGYRTCWVDLVQEEWHTLDLVQPLPQTELRRRERLLWIVPGEGTDGGVLCPQKRKAGDLRGKGRSVDMLASSVIIQFREQREEVRILHDPLRLLDMRPDLLSGQFPCLRLLRQVGGNEELGLA